MKEGCTSLLKHRLTEKPMGTTNKQISLCVHREPMAATAATQAYNSMQSVTSRQHSPGQFCLFCVDFHLFAFPSRGSTGPKCREAAAHRKARQKFPLSCFSSAKGTNGSRGLREDPPSLQTGQLLKDQSHPAPGCRESRAGQEEWFLTTSG